MEGVFFRSRIAGILCVLSPLTALAGPGPGHADNATSGKGYMGNNSPVQFMQNKGQVTDQHGIIRKDIDAKVEANGVTMFVGNGEIHYQWARSRESKAESPKSGKSQNSPESIIENHKSQIIGHKSNIEIYRMDVKLVGANKNAQVIFEEPTGYYENYYLGHTGENGVRAHGYGRIIYKDIYPNIDLVLYTAPVPDEVGGGVSGASVPPPSAKLTPPPAGDNTLSLSPAGGGGEVRAGGGILAQGIHNVSSPRPNGSAGRALGEIEGQNSRGIKYDFVIHPGGNPADIQLRYEGATELKLVDGSLVATTPYGSVTEEAPYSYIAGAGEAVASAYKLSGNTLTFDIGSYTGTLVIDPTLKWATYYGGSGYELENLFSAAADTAGNAYLAGSTLSANNIATTGAHQAVIAGANDFILAKFNTIGARQWGTYYGGMGGDAGFFAGKHLAIDGAGNLYICGYTTSDSGIATSGSYQSTKNNHSDIFIAKFNNSGVRQWGTYYGDTTWEDNPTMACDMAGNVYIAGRVAGSVTSGFFGTPGTFRPTGNYSFIAKFNTNGQRVWGSYINTPGGIYGIAPDAAGNVYITGSTTSDTGIATAGAHQPARSSTGNFHDAYLMKFNSSGQRLWGTYYGGTGQDVSYSLACHGSNLVYITGYTGSTGNIASTGAYQGSLNGTYDGFIALFNGNGQRQWGTYYGGTGSETFYYIAVAPSGDLFVSGTTNNSTGLVTAGAHQTTYGGGLRDGLLAHFSPTGQRIWASYYGGSNTDNAGALSCSKRFVYMAGCTNSSTGIATTGSHQASLAGSYDMFLAQFEMPPSVYIDTSFTDTVACIGDTLHVPYGVTGDFNSNNTFTIQLSNSSGSFSSPTTLATINGIGGDTAACYIPGSLAAGAGYRIRIVASSPADTSFDNLNNIKIYPYPANFTSGVNSPLCTGDTLKLNSGSTTSGVNYTWTGPGGFNSNAEDTIRANATFAFGGDYYITANNNGCMVKDTVSVVVNQTPENVTATNNGGLCTGDTLQLTSSSTTSGVSYAWTGPNNYNTQNVTRPNVQLSDAGTYTVTVTLGSCSDTATTAVVVNQSPTINIVPTTPTTICAGDTAQFIAFPNNAGTNPQLQWTRNGVDIAGATGLTLKANGLNNGDVIAAEVTAATACPGTKESNKITMTVQPILTPTVTMTADNMPPWNGGLTVTFTATPTHGGTAPEYQWKRNGQDITGATGAIWGVIVNALNPNEDICVVLKSNYECAVPDTAMSNCITTAFTGVGDIVNNKNIKIYPNPVSGILHIEVPQRGNYNIRVMNMLGSVVYEGNIKDQQRASIQLGTSLPPGNYAIHISGDALRYVDRITLVK